MKGESIRENWREFRWREFRWRESLAGIVGGNRWRDEDGVSSTVRELRKYGKFYNISLIICNNRV